MLSNVSTSLSLSDKDSCLVLQTLGRCLVLSPRHDGAYWEWESYIRYWYCPKNGYKLGATIIMS
jgi:hypothetical protein